MSSSVIRCGDRIRSGEELLTRAARIATGLRELGVRRGDRVALVLRNDIEFVEISIGIGLIGAIPVPVNWHWKGQELGYLLNDSQAVAVFAHTDLLGAVRGAMSTEVPVIAVEPSSALREAYRLEDTSATADLDFDEWLARHPRPDSVEPASAPMSVIYTSGTTGRPKGIVRQPLDSAGSAAVVASFQEVTGLGPGMSTLVPAPMYHSAPNVHALLAVQAGIDLTIMPRFEPRKLLALIEGHRIQHTQMVPIMFTRLLALPSEARAGFDLSSLRCVVHAAAPCPPDTKRQMIEWLGPIIREYYGGSETGAVVCCTSAEWLEHPGTVGRPCAGADVRIYGPAGLEVATGAVGEIYLKPTDGWPDFTYLGDEHKRRAMERDGYLTVGDIGRLDAHGYLYLSDRATDMVISGGVNIYPAEIEQCLMAIPGVRDAAVFGIPDPDYGEALAAHVDTDIDHGPTEEAIREHIRHHLANYKTPKIIVIDHELPREESGKLFKRRLRDRYRATTPGQSA